MKKAVNNLTFEDLEEKPKKIVELDKQEKKKSRTLLYFFRESFASGTFPALLGLAASKDNVRQRKKTASF